MPQKNTTLKPKVKVADSLKKGDTGNVLRSIKDPLFPQIIHILSTLYIN